MRIGLMRPSVASVGIVFPPRSGVIGAGGLARVVSGSVMGVARLFRGSLYRLLGHRRSLRCLPAAVIASSGS